MNNLLFLAVLFITIWLAGEVRSEVLPHSSPAQKRTLTLRLLSEPETLDWNRAHTPIETYLLGNLMDGLIRLDASLQVHPALAESWKVSADGRTYTFQLKPNVKWSDGVPLRAQDFVTSWKRLLSPATAAGYAYLLYDIVGAKAFNQGQLKDFSKVGIAARGDHTLEVSLNQPQSHWIYIPSFWITFPLRQDILDKYGSEWEAVGKMVTLGPYLLSEHHLESKIVLKSNPNYYGDKSNIDEVHGLIVRDDSTALNLYESGRLDVLTDISSIDLKRLANRKDLKTFPYLKTGYLGFVLRDPTGSHIGLRRAIAMAIDKSKLGSLLYGGQTAATSFVPPPLLGYSKEVGYPFDPKRARQELSMSGIDLSRPIQIELIVPNWDKPLILAQFIQAELKKNLGLDIVLQPFDNKTYRAKLKLQKYALFLASWSADIPDPDNFLSLLLSQSGNNYSGWKNKEFDEKVSLSRHLMNVKDREKIYLQLQTQLLNEDCVLVPLYYEPNKVLVRPYVNGFGLSPLNDLNLRRVNLAN